MAQIGEMTPLISRIVSLLREELETVGEGRSLPTEVDLAAKYGVARKSIRSALARLEKEGAVERIRGKGTFPRRGRQARAMFRPQVKRIGVAGSVSIAGPDEKKGFYAMILEGAYEEALMRGGELVLSGGHTDESRAEACYRLCDDSRVDGLLLVAVMDQDLLAGLASRGKPLCLVDHYSEKAAIDCVRVDSAAGARLAVEHLHNFGHRRIAYLQPPRPYVNPGRLEGYTKALEALGLERREEWLIGAPTTLEGGAQAAMQILALEESKRPTAILAFSDEMAVGAIQEILRFGLRVPEDISVIGAGGINPVVTVGLPEPTSIRFDSAELGRRATERLWERIENPGLEPLNIVVPAQLQIGQSTARCVSAAAERD